MDYKLEVRSSDDSRKSVYLERAVTHFQLGALEFYSSYNDDAIVVSMKFVDGSGDKEVKNVFDRHWLVKMLREVMEQLEDADAQADR